MEREEYKCPKCGNIDVFVSDEDEQGLWAQCKKCLHSYSVDSILTLNKKR